MLRKKLVTLTLLIIPLFLFISCSKDEDSSSSSFSPPSWIHGAWVDNVSSSSKYGWKFDSSDKYMVVFGTLTAGYVALGVSVTQLTSTDSEFSYSWVEEGTSGGTSFYGTVTHVFTKATTSTVVLTGSSTTSYYSVTEGTYTKDTSL